MKMKNITLLCFSIIIISMYSCSSKPSTAQIEKKVLLDYVCPDAAKVNGFKIESTEATESIFGFKGYEYTVSGEIVWQNGCDEFGAGLPAGYSEKFNNKKVTLIKTDQGWQ